MATSRVMKGVLGNFLGTYASRYSDFRGYWLFGFLVSDLGDLRVDLLAPCRAGSDGPLDAAVRFAAERFKDQVQKAGLAPSQVLGAWLTLRRLPGQVESMVNGYARIGHRMRLMVEALVAGGKRYEKELTVFVAPHDPKIEFRSTRAA